MILLVFAHLAEARAFLAHGSWTRIIDPQVEIYQKSGVSLLICGEGMQNATEKTGYALSLLKEVSEVWNWGVAGSLNAKTEKQSIYEIRKVLAERYAREPEFRTYTLSGTCDIVSARSRSLSMEQANFLENFAPLVDRELWAIASVCQFYKKPLRAWKLVSDNASSKECLSVQENAQEYSQQLYSRFMQESPKESLAGGARENLEIYSNPLFYFTRSQKDLLENYLEVLRLQEEKNIWAPVASLSKDKLLPKDRSRKLLELLREKVNPFQAKVKNALFSKTEYLAKTPARVHFHPQYETDTVTFTAEIKNEADYQQAQLALAELPPSV